MCTIRFRILWHTLCIRVCMWDMKLAGRFVRIQHESCITWHRSTNIILLLVQLMSRINFTYMRVHTKYISVHVTCITYGVMQTGQGQLNNGNDQVYMRLVEQVDIHVHARSLHRSHTVVHMCSASCGMHTSADPDHMHMQQVTGMGWCMGRQSETIISYPIS